MKNFNKTRFPLINALYKNDLLKGGSYSFMLKILGLLISYLFTYTISTSFGAEELGKYALSYTVVQIAAILFSLGLPLAIVKLTAMPKYYFNNIFASNYFLKSVRILLVSSLGGTIILLLLSTTLNQTVFKQEGLDIYLKTMAPAVFAVIGIQFIAEFFRGQKRIITFGILVYVLPFIFPLLIIYIGTFSPGRIYPSTAFLYGTLIAFFIALYLLIYKLKKTRFEPHSKNTANSELLKLSLPMLISSALIFILAWTDILMLSYMTSNKDVGVYNVVIKISNLTMLAIVAINNIAAPKIATLHSEEKTPEFIKIVKDSTKTIFFITFPLVLFLAIFSKELLAIFGSEFVVGNTALLILLIGKFINAISGSVGQVLNMTGHQNAFRNITIAMVFMNIILNYILIPLYGICGAAIATTISTVFINIICIVYIKLKFGFYTFYLPFLKLS